MRLLNAQSHAETMLTLPRVLTKGKRGRWHPPPAAPRQSGRRQGAAKRWEERGQVAGRDLPPPRLEVGPFLRVRMGVAEAAGTSCSEWEAQLGISCCQAPEYQTVNVTERWSCVFNFIRRKNSDLCCARFAAPVQIYSAF